MRFELIVFLLVVAIAPSLLTWTRERRLRKLAEQKLAISRCVSAMEELMRDARMISGSAAHDVLFKVMVKVQTTERYGLRWGFRSEQTRRFEHALHAELRDENCPFSQYLQNFTVAYLRAFKAQSPVLSWIYLGYLGCVFFTLKCAQKGLIFILRAVIHVHELRARKKQAQRFVREEYVARAGSALLCRS